MEMSINDVGVRETLCSSCIHKNVCVRKDYYLNILESLREMFYKFPKDERDFMCPRDPDCKFYSKELAMPRALLTQSIGIPENMAAMSSGLRSLRKGCNKMIEAAEAVQNFNRKTDV